MKRKRRKIKKRLSVTCSCTCWDVKIEGAWSCTKHPTMPSRTPNWVKMCTNSGKSATAACAVFRRRANILNALDIIKTKNRSPVFDPSRPEHSPLWHWCSPLEKQPASPSVWITVDFTGLSFTCNCVSAFIHRIVLWFFVIDQRSDFITLWSKKLGTKSSPNDVLQLSEAIIRRVKWFSMPRGTTWLENVPVFFQFDKPPFPDLFPVCVNDVPRVCNGRIEAALPLNFTTHNLKTSRRMEPGLVAFF